MQKGYPRPGAELFTPEKRTPRGIDRPKVLPGRCPGGLLRRYRLRGRRRPQGPVFFGLPNTRHIDAIVFSPSRSHRDGKFGTARKEIFVRVLESDRATLESTQIPAEYLVDSLPPEPDKNIDQESRFAGEPHFFRSRRGSLARVSIGHH
jgi:hypothetical protein